ncbi:MAG: hypothetical protein BET99_04555 [Marine Group III euryarchaeote CG-Epi2]|uniref:Phytoene synthase n=1 Tax=Marine Group III euryarchaeote CG-Epi2 TaxID=1888996 RepID=A0A1J5TZU8_9ARCH|nr:MAG: hypothetical protein BET99_05235 [Marine Group III euryarchaeote CG-Epi2]OIR22356.1 MAG: hypothetical protein BET99_04555 [Marine Group III euryarchaeote CG-Epi2]
MYSKANLIDDNTPTDPESIFQKGSTTYYHSTKLFPTKIRKDVTTLYCFVRVVDDFVDAVPQDLESFNSFKDDYYKALSGKEVNNSIISNYIELSYRKGFEAEWTDAFLKSMEMDTYKSEYNNLGELNDYLYGSSEVIGLMMNKVMDIDERAHDSARYLGKAMQFINFIRDIDEDLDLNRTYFPKDTLAKFGLEGLTRGEARRKPKQFRAFVRSQIKVYFDWQKKAETGFVYLPKRMRVAVKTASDMYMWTATKIYKNPFLVYDMQLKPAWNKVLLAGIKNYFSIYLSFNNKSTPIQEPSINNTRTV